MCDIFGNINLNEALQTVAAIFTAGVAYFALNTWKSQAKASKSVQFLDEITDQVHEYIQSLNQPIHFLRFIIIGIESHKVYGPEGDTKYSNVIEYIKRRGSEDSKEFWELINSSNESVAKIQALVARGQVYSLKNYSKCQDSIKLLLWQHQRLQIVAAVIQSPNMNWENSVVLKSIENMLTVTPESIEEYLQEQNVNYLDFANENYRSVY